MRLKIATTALLIFGLALLLLWPWVVGPRPPADAPKPELAAFAVRLMIYMGATILTFAVTAALALLVARQARKQYREEALANLRELIEGTLKDHGSKKS